MEWVNLLLLVSFVKEIIDFATHYIVSITLHDSIDLLC